MDLLDVSDHEGALRQSLLELDDNTASLKKAVARMPGGWAAFEEAYYVSWIYHENGLEGVVLSYPEIRSAVDNKIISDASLLPTYQNIKSHKACIDLIRERATNKRFAITLNFVKDLHGRLVGDPELAGVYRKDIPIHRTYFHEISQPAKIHTDLVTMLEYLKTASNSRMHPIELSASVHYRFMRVFPFSDYSGIIGRLIANFVILRHGYLPTIVHATDRQHYYEALRGPEREFLEFTLSSMGNSLENAHRFAGSIRGRQTATQAAP